MIGEYINKPNQDLKNYLFKKGLNNNESMDKLGNREDNEDEWEIIGTFIVLSINKILEKETWKKVIGGNDMLVQEVTEILDGNDMLDSKSLDVLYLDFGVKSEAVISENNKLSNEILSVISVFELEKDENISLKKQNIKYHEILGNILA